MTWHLLPFHYNVSVFSVIALLAWHFYWMTFVKGCHSNAFILRCTLLLTSVRYRWNSDIFSERWAIRWVSDWLSAEFQGDVKHTYNHERWQQRPTAHLNPCMSLLEMNLAHVPSHNMFLGHQHVDDWAYKAPSSAYQNLLLNQRWALFVGSHDVDCFSLGMAFSSFA